MFEVLQDCATYSRNLQDTTVFVLMSRQAFSKLMNCFFFFLRPCDSTADMAGEAIRQLAVHAAWSAANALQLNILQWFGPETR